MIILYAHSAMLWPGRESAKPPGQFLNILATKYNRSAALLEMDN